jgi:type II secretory pathway pseudopilin PulG
VRDRAGEGRSEHGETLVEILVAVAILGLAATALIGALGTITSASSLHRHQATAETAIRSYAEAVKAAGYRDCRAPATYAAADVGFAVPAGFDSAPPVVSYWDGTDFRAGCPPATASRPQLQLVTLEVHALDGQESETVSVTMRSP